jgi:hypothetical protein
MGMPSSAFAVSAVSDLSLGGNSLRPQQFIGPKAKPTTAITNAPRALASPGGVAVSALSNPTAPPYKPDQQGQDRSGPMWVSFVTPFVALFVGILNLAWNYKNSRDTTRLGEDVRKTARKTGAINPYRAEALVELKQLRAQVNELAAIPRAANYAGSFRPVQNRFTESERRLRDTLSLMSLDPEIDGDGWHDCLSDPYDQFLDCCNTLLSPDTSEDDHRAARGRLQNIVQSIQALVLGRFSAAIDRAEKR